MFRWLTYKSCILSLTLWLIATLTFLLMRGAPGSPFDEEQALPQQIRESLFRYYGLDEPWYYQYYLYFSRLLTGDLGSSFSEKGRTVLQIITDSFPVSALLGFEALCLAVPVGILLGAVAAYRSNGWIDWGLLVLFSVGSSLPTFATAILLQLTFGLWLAWLPLAKLGSIAHTILPAISLAVIPAIFIGRLMREHLLSIRHQPYLLMARAKGLSPWRIFLHHQLRNISAPFFIYLGPLLANLLTGSFVVEKIFSIPGLGFWFVQSIAQRDYPAIMGITLFYSFILLSSVTIAEAIAAWIDPRLRDQIRTI